MRRKIFALIAVFAFIEPTVSAQGCSDGGICTIGNYGNDHPQASGKPVTKHELDLLFTMATHGKQERFFQPQINYRLFRKNNSYFEFRVPLNVATNKWYGVTTTGIGDIIATYNNKLFQSRQPVISYSLGLRISLTDATKKDERNVASYPMSLQTGLGTTDLLIAANYAPIKYLSLGGGLQVPIWQYNKNKAVFSPGIESFKGEGYRRRPDALLKLTGHYSIHKLKLNAGVLSIFHLGEDYYKTYFGNYYLDGSSGITLNWNVEAGYSFGKKWMIGLTVAQPFKTRAYIPDGLARSRIISPRISYVF
jgi:hypothetical protein